MIDNEQIFFLLSSPRLYSENLVYAIGSDGVRQLYSGNEVKEALAKKETIKIEGMERISERIWSRCRELESEYNHRGNVSCHLFLALPGATSFYTHVDLQSVLVQVIDGKKTMEVDSHHHELLTDESLFIPKGVKHRAINTEGSAILSFGFEQFIEKALYDV